MAKIIPRGIEFAVVSAGGVATTEVIDFLALRHAVNTASDEDGFKHMPLPPVSFNARFRFVHIFGNPVTATISLFRRGYHALQSRKLQRGNKPCRPIPLEMTIEEYASRGEDLFQFERFFDNYHRHLLHPTLFLRYETLWENQDALKDFLGLTAEEMTGFPSRRERTSASQQPPRETVVALEAIYRNLSRRLDAVPDAFVESGRSGGVLRVIASRNFRVAVINGVVSRFRPVTGPYGE